MTLYQKFLVNIIVKKMVRKFKFKDRPEIPADGVIEHLDIPYQNRSGKELLMDIYEPENKEKDQELPVIISIHGGGLISGDKKNTQGFCRLLAKRGYLVFSLEYRLVPIVRVYEQIDDVCAGMDIVGKKLIDFDVDLTRICMSSESSGSYLAMYALAMSKSKVLQEAIGYEPSKMQFKAAAFLSGMFYTRRKDSIGRFMSPMFYGKDEKSKKIAEYTNPEHPEIINNLPPSYLMTSKADMLERYTIDFAGSLGSHNIEHRLHHMGSSKKLLHGFPSIRPDYPESEFVIDQMVDWFKKHE